MLLAFSGLLCYLRQIFYGQKPVTECDMNSHTVCSIWLLVLFEQLVSSSKVHFLHDDMQRVSAHSLSAICRFGHSYQRGATSLFLFVGDITRARVPVWVTNFNLIRIVDVFDILAQAIAWLSLVSNPNVVVADVALFLKQLFLCKRFRQFLTHQNE